MNKEKTQNNQPNQPDWIDHVIIRHLIYEDLPQLEWGDEYMHFRQVYLKAYKNRNEGKSLIWVADLPGEGIIGQVFIQLNSVRKDLADGFYSAYLYSFRIKPEFRNAGLGTTIMSIVENDLKKRKFRELTLNVAKENTDGIRLYQKLGYEIIGSESGEWTYRDHNNNQQNIVEPAWKMVKSLQ
ncbi:MAG TPA: N-acetyltransferase [Anaerolineaceae bacterium]|nr:N-acetyltransferase [Anaerolineaceae bacterium]